MVIQPSLMAKLHKENKLPETRTSAYIIHLLSDFQFEDVL